MGKPFFKYEYEGFGGCKSICNLEIHRNLVICSAREDNEGTSITNVAEQLATEIANQYLPDPSKLVWVEHYPKRTVGNHESWDLVFFNVKNNGVFRDKSVDVQFSNPRWVRIEEQVVNALRETFGGEN